MAPALPLPLALLTRAVLPTSPLSLYARAGSGVPRPRGDGCDADNAPPRRVRIAGRPLSRRPLHPHHAACRINPRRSPLPTRARSGMRRRRKKTPLGCAPAPGLAVSGTPRRRRTTVIADPTCAEIADCCSHLKIPYEIKSGKAYPRAFFEVGRAKVQLKRDDGPPINPEVTTSDVFTEEQNELIESSVEMLYGLIHARYILTTKGLAAMLEKFKNYDFGRCPRVSCCGQPCLPAGQSDIPRSSTVKIYCPKCEDLYYPRSKYQGNTDGAYFGTTFPHLFLMANSHLKPQKPSQRYIPRVFGFKVNKKS